MHACRSTLEDPTPRLVDASARFGLEMAVDGMDPDDVDELLQARMDEALAERRAFAALCASAATYAPAFGMIGTLVGLTQMLQRLATPEALGPAMAVAMITTLYGAVLANAVFLPLAGRQRAQLAQLVRQQELVRAGVLGMVRGEGPAALQKRLAAYLDVPPARPAAPVTRLRRVA